MGREYDETTLFLGLLYVYRILRDLSTLKENKYTFLACEFFCMTYIFVYAILRCAPAGTRTPNDGSEDRCDIHFTTGAIILQKRIVVASRGFEPLLPG